jgi:hypothetical protein
VEAHAQANPDAPEAAVMRDRIAGWRQLYLAEGRDVLGFGLYLFGKPGA